MLQVPMNYGTAIDRDSILSINQRRVQSSVSAQTIQNILVSSLPVSDTSHTPGNPVPSAPEYPPAGTGAPFHSTPISCTPSPNIQQPIATNAPPPRKPIPNLIHQVQKGQKVLLNGVTAASKIKACLGWNTANAQCDVDVSAFLLGPTGKVIGDEWFVFYGQTDSPDHSTQFSTDNGADREYITIDFSKLNPNVAKVVFVLTIHEALENHLNFSMLSDAYIRVLQASDNSEVVSFKMNEYYNNVTSMMIGEIYKHNGVWKFNAIGNGVARDLAGLCELYGVQIV